jgi:hypothetical protein
MTTRKAKAKAKASAKATANANAGISPLRVRQPPHSGKERPMGTPDCANASVEMAEGRGREADSSAALRNDSQKSKNKNNSNSKDKGNSNSNSKAKANTRAFGSAALPQDDDIFTSCWPVSCSLGYLPR